METVAIQIPASLFAAIYAKHQSETGLVISECLNQLLRTERSDKKEKKTKAHHMRPGEGTITGRVWEIADHVFNDLGRLDRTAVVEACIKEGININTANTQYTHWRYATIKSEE